MTGAASGTPTLEQVLRSLGHRLADGCVRIEAGGRRLRIFLRQGTVTGVDDPSGRMQLDRHLVSGGWLTTEALTAATDGVDLGSDGALAQRLLRLDVIDALTLNALAGELLVDALAELTELPCSWTVGDDAQTGTTLGVQIGVEQLFTEVRARALAMRQVGERSKRWEGPPRPVRRLHGHAADLRPKEWALLRRIDGTRTVAELGPAAGLSEFETLRLLEEMLAAGLIEVDGGDFVAHHTDEPPAPLHPPADEDAGPANAGEQEIEVEDHYRDLRAAMSELSDMGLFAKTPDEEDVVPSGEPDEGSSADDQPGGDARGDLAQAEGNAGQVDLDTDLAFRELAALTMDGLARPVADPGAGAPKAPARRPGAAHTVPQSPGGSHPGDEAPGGAEAPHDPKSRWHRFRRKGDT